MSSNNSYNGRRAKYLRDDLWLNGHFDFLWEKWKDHPKKIDQLNRIRLDAYNSKQPKKQ